MKRPLTNREKGWRVLFASIVFLDLIFVGAALSAFGFLASTHEWAVAPTVCFALPTTPFGKCDIWTFVQVSTSTYYGDEFVEDFKVVVATDALIYNPEFNQTGESVYFAFEGQGIYNNATSCTTSLPVPLGVELSPYPPSTQTRTHYFGSGETCFLYGGSYVPIITIIFQNGTKFYLPEASWQDYSLTVQPSGSVLTVIYNDAEFFLAFVLVFFGLLESIRTLIDVHPKAFPERIEYVSYRGHKEKRTRQIEQPRKNPEGNAKPEESPKSERTITHKDVSPDKGK